MTKTELKYAVMATGSHFFDRSSMKFFGDTMKNYAVTANPVEIENTLGDVYQCWELRRIHPVKHGLQSSAYFDCLSFERVHPKQ